MTLGLSASTDVMRRGQTVRLVITAHLTPVEMSGGPARLARVQRDASLPTTSKPHTASTGMIGPSAYSQGSVTPLAS